MEAISKVGYRPNAVARSLVTGRSSVIGLVVADVTNPFFPALVRGVEDAAGQDDHLVVVCNTDEDPQKELRYLEMLERNQVAGIILAASRADDDALAEVADRHYPLILINRELPHPNVCSISTDDGVGVEVAVTHLIETGCTRLGYLPGPARSRAAALRAHTFRNTVSRIFPAQPVRMVPAYPPTREGGRDAMLALLQQLPEVDGVLAYNDLMAMGALDAMRSLGLRVPEQIAVVGYDGIDLAALADPPLTTVVQPAYRLGYESYRLLRNFNAQRHDDPLGSATSSSSLRVRPQLVVRASTRGRP